MIMAIFGYHLLKRTKSKSDGLIVAGLIVAGLIVAGLELYVRGKIRNQIF
jgi:hypothetical protein